MSIATECYWSNDDAQDRGPTQLNASFAENVWFPLRILAEQAVSPRRAWADAAAWNEDGHVRSVEDVSAHALHTVAGSQADLIYLHIPAPHPPDFLKSADRKIRGGRLISGFRGFFRPAARSNS